MPNISKPACSKTRAVPHGGRSWERPECSHQPGCTLVWWAGQSRHCQHGSLTVPHKARGHILPGSPVWISRSQGQEKGVETTLWCRLGDKTPSMQVWGTSKGWDRDSPGEKSEIQLLNDRAENVWVMTGHSNEVWVPSGPWHRQRSFCPEEIVV